MHHSAGLWLHYWCVSPQRHHCNRPGHWTLPACACMPLTLDFMQCESTAKHDLQPLLMPMACSLLLSNACSACMRKAHLPDQHALPSAIRVAPTAYLRHGRPSPCAGPNGASVREVCRQTGADIKSWTDQSRDEASRSPRPTRTFVIEAHPSLSSHVCACATFTCNPHACGIVQVMRTFPAVLA